MWSNGLIADMEMKTRVDEGLRGAERRRLAVAASEGRARPGSDPATDPDASGQDSSGWFHSHAVQKAGAALLSWSRAGVSRATLAASTWLGASDEPQRECC